MAWVRRDGFYDTIDDALAEVQGLRGSSASAFWLSSSFDVPSIAAEDAKLSKVLAQQSSH